MIAYYEMDDAADSGSLSMDLTAYGSITYAEGKIGNCAVFNGSSWFYIQNNMLMEMFWDNRPFTVTGWFKTTNTTTAQNIITANDGGYLCDTFKIGMYLAPGWTGKVRYNRENGAEAVYIMSNNIYTDNAWHMFVCSYDRETMVLDMDNGAERISLASSIKLNHTSHIRIGSTDYGVTDPSQVDGITQFQGSIDQVRFYNYALSTEEIAELWNGGAGK
jgi:hypothetical protein